MNTKNKFEALKTAQEQLTQTITYHIAASIISNSEFPKKDSLPTLSPSPFNSLGHYVSLDYRLLIQIIWQVVNEIKDTGAKVYKKWPSTKNFVISGVVGLVLFFILRNNSSGWFWALVIAGIWLFFSTRNSRLTQFYTDVSKIRAEAIRKLIAGEWTSALDSVTSTQIEEGLNAQEIGDGVLGSDQIPILVIKNNNNPLPGYGRLQTENQFICRPKASDTANEHHVEADFKTIQDNIVDAVANFVGGEMTYGDVLVIHGDTLRMDSPWLNKNKAPKLWADQDMLNNFASIDGRVSIRRYFAVQLFFKDYSTVATFFVRPFMAGNSLCCRISISTIGPLYTGIDYFQKRLRDYEEEEKKGYGKKPKISKEEKKKAKAKQKKKNKIVSTATRLLQSARTEKATQFQSRSINYREIKELVFQDKEADKDYKEEFEELVKKNRFWLGDQFTNTNLRDTYSLTFTNDFFGRTESIASLSTLYDQISRSILDTIDSLGYDITNYRDSEGNYSINADKIEQLVIGEKIQVADKKLDKQDSQAGNNQGERPPQLVQK